MSSVEEKVEEHFKGLLKNLNIRYYGKTEKLNSSIVKAFKESVSKSGEIDWEYMEKYIKATEKVVIKNVVDWKDEEISLTKEVLNNG